MSLVSRLNLAAKVAAATAELQEQRSRRNRTQDPLMDEAMAHLDAAIVELAACIAALARSAEDPAEQQGAVKHSCAFVVPDLLLASFPQALLIETERAKREVQALLALRPEPVPALDDPRWRIGSMPLALPGAHGYFVEWRDDPADNPT